MSTPFQDAVHEYLRAYLMSKEDRDSGSAAVWREESDRALAQAGDVLESTLRSMMREEAGRLAGETVRVVRAPPISPPGVEL